MKAHHLMAWVLIALLNSCEEPEKQPIDDLALPRATPEEVGVSSVGLQSFIDSIQTSDVELHHLMIVRQGKVIVDGRWKPYKRNYKHQLYSLSKSFTSTAVGFAVQEGKLQLSDNVVSFFPDSLSANGDDKLKDMTIEHLLTMSTGHEGETINLIGKNGEPWHENFLKLPIKNHPGSTFFYNTGATYMLSVILQSVTGKTVVSYLKEKYFEPLGIKDSDWLLSPDSINTGGYGLRVTCESLAKHGQFYLQKGNWRGEQLLDSSWVDMATSRRVASSGSDGNFEATHDWAQGYGFQFWRNSVDGYRADGAFGQFCLVLPKYEAVVAITGQSSMGEVLSLIWDELVPLFQDENLPANEEGVAALKEQIRRLKIYPVRYRSLSPLAFDISGKIYELEENDLGAASVSFDIDTNLCRFTLTQGNGKVIPIDAGFNKYVLADNIKDEAGILFPTTTWVDLPSKIVASATWKETNVLILDWRFVETAHADQLTCTFEKSRVKIEFLNSVARMNGQEDPRPAIYGTIKN